MKKTSDICVLSGLVIPEGKYSREHYLAKSLCPYDIANLKENIFPSIKVFNQIKGNLYPCVWMSVRYDLCQKAVQDWNLSRSDKALVKKGLSWGLPEYDACRFCIAVKFREWCMYNRD